MIKSRLFKTLSASLLMFALPITTLVGTYLLNSGENTVVILDEGKSSFSVDDAVASSEVSYYFTKDVVLDTSLTIEEDATIANFTVPIVTRDDVLTTSSTDSTSESSTTPTWLYVVLGVLGLFVVINLIFCLLILIKKRKRKNKRAPHVKYNH